MVDSGRLLIFDEYRTRFFGTLSQLSEYALAVAFFVIVLTSVGIFLVLGQHRIDQAGELMGGGGDGLGFVHTRAHSPCTANTFLARSMPMVMMLMNFSFRGLD